MGVTISTANAGTTYKPIATQTLGSSSSSVTFSSIPQTYTDLVLVYNGISSASATATFQFNSDTGSNYSNTYVLGNGSSTSSGNGTNTSSMYQFYPTTTYSSAVSHILNYSNSNVYKTVLTRSSNTANYSLANVGLWRNTSAITQIVVGISTGTFSSGSTFTLYGIKAA
jgi:hypothetical protein